jgi:hypothetical protein
MTALFDALPQCAEIDGVLYELNTDYRVALRIITAFEDASLADFEKQCIMIKLLYKTPPPDMEKAAEIAVKFLNCGDENGDDGEAPLYSFTKDAPFIYSAVSGVCGADVLEKPLHWYRFSAYFRDIREDAFFSRLIYLRRGVRTGKLSTEERRAAASLSNYMSVPSAGVEENADAAEFMSLLKMGEKEGNFD